MSVAELTTITDAKDHNFREGQWHQVWYKPDVDDPSGAPWVIGGVNYCVATISQSPGFWGIPSTKDGEKHGEDIGPFDTLAAAAVALTLMQ
jgi:hypothetical protein